MNSERVAEIERKLSALFVQLPGHLQGKYRSVQFMRDDDFIHRRDRTSNDIHAFFELRDGTYFHLRGYTRHMLDASNPEKVFLSGYRKPAITHTGGIHSFKQDWYAPDAAIVAHEIVGQTGALFRND